MLYVPPETTLELSRVGGNLVTYRVVRLSGRSDLPDGQTDRTRWGPDRGFALVSLETGMNEEFVTALVNVRNALDRRLERNMCREEVRAAGRAQAALPLVTTPVR